MKQQIIVIVGPNASGKTSLSIKIAKKINGEIISADSRQVYKGLDIGSGKVTKMEMHGIQHHCLSIANPKKIFSALDFKNRAERAIADILSRGKTPIIVGGTGFYIDAALGRMKLGGVPTNPKLRKKLSHYSLAKLNATLAKLDPERARTVEQKNPVRLIRAIEIIKAKKADKNSAKGERFSERVRASEPPQRGLSASETESARLEFLSDSRIQWIGIKRPPEELKKRIHKRLTMRLPGIIREVKKLHNPPTGGGLSWKRLFELGLEYRYASLYLRGKISKFQLTDQLNSQIWHYAKRQMTWFKKNKEIRWISSTKMWYRTCTDIGHMRRLSR